MSTLAWKQASVLFESGVLKVANPMSAPTSDDKLWAGLSYAGLVCCMIPTIVIFLLKKGESDYIKFNALQAMGFWLVGFVIGIVFNVGAQIPGIGFVLGLAYMIISLGLLGYWIYLMIQGFTGKEVRIPVLGDWIEQNLMN